MNDWEWQLLEDKSPLDAVMIDGCEIKTGNRVRLRPRSGGDILDIALAGQTAIVESIEQDYEGKSHVCVVIEDDPGRDLGMLRQPGHRFFFDSTEIEPLPLLNATPAKPKTKRPRILVAGIGNIFFGDDGFGVEVAKCLAERSFSSEVKVADFGIRGLDLAYALQDGYETIILVDAYPHGQPPGTVSLIEPDLSRLDEPGPPVVDAHGMNPMTVLRMAAMMGGSMGKVFLVGCEPAALGGDEGHMGLSQTVVPAVDEAVNMVSELVEKLLHSKQ